MPSDLHLLRFLWKARDPMIHTTPVLRLTDAQIGQLSGYCSQYRSSLWLSAPPTPERNHLIRCLQGLQARLEKAREQKQAETALPVTVEEKHTLSQLFRGLIQWYASQPPDEARTQHLRDLTGWRVLIERMCRETGKEAMPHGRQDH